MQAKAIIKYLRIAPRKIRLVLNTIRRKSVSEALSRLAIQKQKGARLAEQAVKSALANAKVLKMDTDRLVVFEIKADGGPSFKRHMSRSMGRADKILKRTTHITVVLQEGAKSQTPPPPPAVQEEKQSKKKRTLSGKK